MRLRWGFNTYNRDVIEPDKKNEIIKQANAASSESKIMSFPCLAYTPEPIIKV